MTAAPDRTDDGVLDNPIWHALLGPQADLAVRRPLAARFEPDVTPFAALSDPSDPAAWADLAELIGPGGAVPIAAPADEIPASWHRLRELTIEQMVDDDVRPVTEIDPRIVELTAADVPAMTELVRRTDPGPFEARTIELGGFVGVRIDGELVAMAGRRMHPPGWVEITAVCTDPAYRGRGLARAVLDAVVAGIHAEGDRAFLHVMSHNAAAIALYLDYGFVVRRANAITVVQAPN